MGIDVEGGVGGTTVGLEALDSGAVTLHGVAGQLLESVAALGVATAGSGLVETHLLSPGTAAVADAAVVDAVGPAGLAGDAVAVEDLALLVRAVVAAYRAADASVEAAIGTTQDVLAGMLGHDAPGLAVGLLVLEALGADVGHRLDELVFALPGAADLGGHTGALSLGVAANPATGPLLLPGLLGRWREPGLAGGGVGPDGVGLRVLAGTAQALGLLDDHGEPRVRAEPSPRAGAGPPHDLASLARDLGNVGDGERYAAHVRVVEVPQAHGSAWVVEIPGTQAWGPQAGANPYDVTTDVRLTAQQSTVLAGAVSEALDRAQAAAGRDAGTDPVLLTGHSLGGMVAAGLASSPAFRARHGEVGVVTMGSPVSRMPVPSSVSVLSIEHVQDAVPRLDGQGNPDRASWVTVRRDLRGDPSGVSTAGGAHGLHRYVDTAAEVDRSSHPSVVAWREQHRAFFEPGPGQTATVRDFRVERLPGPGAG